MPWLVKAWKPDAYVAQLRVLEALGDELLEDVRRRRDTEPEITVRRRRASLHDSPLGELFKATR